MPDNNNSNITETSDVIAKRDKDNLIKKTEEYLQKNPVSSLNSTEKIQETAQSYRENATNFLREGNFSEAIANLERAREAKTGIKTVEINGKPLILIRDARNAADPKVRSTESFEMQYLNDIRAAMDLVDIKYPIDSNDNEIKKKNEEIKQNLQNQAQEFLQDFSKDSQNASQEDLSVKVGEKIIDLTKQLEGYGIDNASKKLNVAQNFQNFNDKHANISTISTITDKDNKQHSFIEAEVGFRKLTKNQEQEYANVQNKFLKTKPTWFTVLPNWESKLVKKYIPQITDGQHTISTQLTQIVGMKNAFEKITATYDEKINKVVEIAPSAKHAGTLVSDSKDKDSQQRITNLNAEQTQEWMGPNTKVHTNTLNSGFKNFSLPYFELKIVNATDKAMKFIGGKNTNTAFNSMRLFGGFNNFEGAKDYLKEVSNNLIDTNANDMTKLARIGTHLEPRGFISRTFGLNRPKGNFEELIKEANLSPELAKALTNARDLRLDIEKADVPYRLFGDKENISADISRKLHNVTVEISDLVGDIPLKNMPKYETLTMCKSGKDRTGESMHDKSANAAKDKFGIDIHEADRQLLKAGHTANQTGSIYAGGATVGCHGTLKQTSQGFPESRAKDLAGMIEVSGGTNKIIKYEKKVKKAKKKNIKTQKANKKALKKSTASYKPDVTPSKGKSSKISKHNSL